MPTYTGKKLEFTDQNGNIFRMIPVDSTEKGAAEGVATLDASGKVPVEQLPDTAHVHLYSARSAFPSSGIDGDLYIDKDTNVIYRWDSTESDYISISSAGGSGVITVSGTITNTSGSYSGTFNDARIVSTMKCILLELGTPSIFGGYVSVSCSDGSITITCDEVAGSSTFIVSFIASMASSTEYDALNNAKVDKVTTAVSGNVVIFGPDGTIVDSEKTLGKSVPADAVFTDTTYNDATQSASGLMSSSDKTKLDGIAQNANNYSLPTASSTAKGGILIGFTQSEKNYPVQLDSNNKAYVNVPWTDNNTTYSAGTGISLNGTTFSLASGIVTAGSAGPTANVSGNNAIDVPRITVDTYGRVTALSSKTYTGTNDTNTTYSAGTGISLSGTTFSLASGVVTAGSAGPTANVSGANSISVPRITVDTYGRVTALSSKTYTGTTDTNTWRPVQDNFTSTSTTDCLSAYRGKLLNDAILNHCGIHIEMKDATFTESSGAWVTKSVYWTNGFTTTPALCAFQTTLHGDAWAIASWDKNGATIQQYCPGSFTRTIRVVAIGW